MLKETVREHDANFSVLLVFGIFASGQNAIIQHLKWK